MTEPIMRIENLKVFFPAGKREGIMRYVKAVDDVTFEINPGEIMGLVGESGSGKSTIAYTIIGMYKPTAGDVVYQGKSLHSGAKTRPLELKRDIQIVFQDPGSSLNSQQSVKEILELPLRVHHICSDKKSLEQKVGELLDMVELPRHYMYKSPLSMGGGERQMIAIARALATNPRFIILDEPTSALDVSIQAKIINMLLRLQKERGLTYLFITHDLSLMRNISTHVAILYLGKIAEIAPTDVFFQTPCHPYTQMLLSSIPVISEEEESLKPAKVESIGEIPSPVDVPPGCSFHMRCQRRLEQCDKDDPQMRALNERHLLRCHI